MVHDTDFGAIAVLSCDKNIYACQANPSWHHSSEFTRKCLGCICSILLVKRIDYPLWMPEPSNPPLEYKREGVNIGDVGVITFDGQFKFLFNIFSPGTDPLNRRAPPAFECLEYHEDEVQRRASVYSPRQAIAGGSIGDPTERENVNSHSEPQGIG
jgi:hypothetical protein